MHILISPNAFKNSIDAAAAAKAIEEGLQQSSLVCTTQCFPVGDGGDGTGHLLTEISNGIFINESVHDPLERKINADYGLIDNGQTAVIEMAVASGLRLLRHDEPDPLLASSFGTGELIRKALDKGVKKIFLCVGGSATVDAGCGILEAMGIRFLDANGNQLKGIPKTLTDLADIDLSGSDKRISRIDLTILADVSNPLLGEKGAAKIFGPQKGASDADVKKLEASLKRFNQIVLERLGMDMSETKHGGAAGGTAAALKVLLHANIANGIDEFLTITHFDVALQKADLVITGEGSIDLQTLEGKAPYGVALRAMEKNIPVIGFAGKIPEAACPELDRYFNRLININRNETDMAAAMLAVKDNLVRSALELGNLLAAEQKK
jgi:glycerate kinase